jgi:Na+-translocating ferredoxin:NAD+ oxidoreductase RnfG subunit
MKKFYLAISFLLSIAFVASQEIDLPKTAKKKVFKSFDALWEGEEIQTQRISNEIVSAGEIHKSLKKLQLFQLDGTKERKGYLFLSAAPSRYNDFDLMVIYNQSLEIIATKVLIYREDWGAEIGSKRWLKQFLGKSAQDELRLGYEIQGISGATVSVISATNAITLMTSKISELKKSGHLD